MHLKSYFSICLLSLAFFKTTAQDIKIDSSSVRTLRIDPQNARGATVSQVFDEVEFIPLETTRESLFGNISSLKIVENNYVLFDYDTRAVLIFTAQGKFKAKIKSSEIPQDEEESSKSQNKIWGYQIVKEGDRNLIKINTPKYAFLFDLAGKLIKKTPSKGEKYISPFRFSDGKTSISRFFEKITGKDTTRYQMVFVKNNRDSIGYFPFKLSDGPFSGGGIYNGGQPDEFLYINNNSYDLFKITPDKIRLAYRIILPAANTFTKDMSNNPLYKKDRFKFFQDNKAIVQSISNIYLLGDYLYLKFNNSDWSRTAKKALIYNLKTGELISLQDLEPDARSYFLPVNDAGAYYDFMNNSFYLYENDYLYTSYSSLAMFGFKDQSESKKATYPAALADYFKNGSRKSNPVIIKLKPKKQ